MADIGDKGEANETNPSGGVPGIQLLSNQFTNLAFIAVLLVEDFVYYLGDFEL